MSLPRTESGTARFNVGVARPAVVEQHVRLWGLQVGGKEPMRRPAVHVRLTAEQYDVDLRGCPCGSWLDNKTMRPRRRKRMVRTVLLFAVGAQVHQWQRDSKGRYGTSGNMMISTCGSSASQEQATAHESALNPRLAGSGTAAVWTTEKSV